MKQPTVCAIMLVNGREEMVKRAVRSFESQTYERKKLLIFNTGPNDHRDPEKSFLIHVWMGDSISKRLSVGKLRNEAIGWTDQESDAEADIIVHWDSDDWSHPRRIEEQVALLQSSGKSCVGYRDMVFWRTWLEIQDHGLDGKAGNLHEESWLYRCRPEGPQCLGTSLCYWREAWERTPFRDTNVGEDADWLAQVEHQGVSSLSGAPAMMIATIHGGNTSGYRSLTPPEWTRTPELDAEVRRIMEAA